MSLKDFTQAYIDALRWSEVAYSVDGADLGNFDGIEGDLSPGALRTIEGQCAEYYWANEATWTAAGMDDAQAGHDFCLTRNRHGVGFWDRGLGAVGEQLTETARLFGEQHLVYCGEGNPVEIM